MCFLQRDIELTEQGPGNLARGLAELAVHRDYEIGAK